MLGGLCAPPAGGAQSLTAAQLAALDLRSYSRSTTPPAFTLRTPAGEVVSLVRLRGKVVIVNFWATWCRECLTEMPALETLHRRFAARGLAVVGVGVRENATAVRRYAREVGTTFPLLADADGAVTARYGVIGLPTTFLIGADAEAVALAIGAREWASAAAVDIVEHLVNHARAAPAERRERR
jgi:peroxiredoxin